MVTDIVQYPFSENALALKRECTTLSAKEAIHHIISAVADNTITKTDAVMLTGERMLNSFLFPSVVENTYTNSDVIAKHNLSTLGAGCGKIITREEMNKYESPEALKNAVGDYVLYLKETTQSDNRWIDEASAVITETGGAASHTTIYTRMKKIPAIIGLGSQVSIVAGQDVTVDATNGKIIAGIRELQKSDIHNPDLIKLLSYADEQQINGVHRLKIKANEQDPESCKTAREMGAVGIGVARTEFMFDGEERLPHMQAMAIYAYNNNKDGLQTELDALFPMQKGDFKGILEAMDGLPSTIRLLDEPFHEFKPKDDDEFHALAESMGMNSAEVEAAFPEEKNPMLGLRAVRLAMLHPEIYEMQMRAILEAAAELATEGKNPQPQIMIPLISKVEEVVFMKQLYERVKKEVEEKYECAIESKYGVMMEVPSACIYSPQIAPLVEFYSFGTNDLTQTTLGMSRDDTGLYIAATGNDPFQTLDGAVIFNMDLALRGKAQNQKLQASICGEHGADERSIYACQRLGLDAISVSAPSLPKARLIAAQAHILDGMQLSQTRINALSDDLPVWKL